MTPPIKLSDEQVAQVVDECSSYFERPNWYRSWFHWLEKLLSESGAGSYLDGSACHLDLVQWATKPAQAKLQSEDWRRLVEQDREFLGFQLNESNLNIVLMNGASIVTGVQEAVCVVESPSSSTRETANRSVAASSSSMARRLWAPSSTTRKP